MSSRFPKLLSIVSLAFLLSASLASCTRPSQATPVRKLRVCADPNNLPFSNQKLEGFENRIAELIARDLDAEVQYTWWAQRRGFIRNTLESRSCDVVIGVPSGFERAKTTRPYYRSSYVFVYRKDRGIKPNSFDDPLLRRVKVGVQVIGDDGANSPPAHALSNRGIIQNIRGYTVYGDYAQDSPPAGIVDAVADGEVDVAVVWGPLAGYRIKKKSLPLEMALVSSSTDGKSLPLVYDISMGVRRHEEAFKEELEAVIDRRRAEINDILDQYNIPRVR